MTQTAPAIWVGCFTSREEAETARTQLRSADVEAFDSDRWLTRQNEMLSLARSGISPRATDLPRVVEATQVDLVIDLGGGSGWVAEFSPTSWHDRGGRIAVLEMPATVEAFRGSSPRALHVDATRTDTWPDWLTGGLLYSNSALQYLPETGEPGSLAALVSLLAPAFILLDDVQVSTRQSFYSLQRYYGDFIVTRFLDPDGIAADLEPLGYTLVSSHEYAAQFSAAYAPAVEGRTDEDPDRGTPVTLLFERRTQAS